VQFPALRTLAERPGAKVRSRRAVIERTPEEKVSDAVLTGVETRTSSPIRIARNAHYQSLNTAGLFPAGEGAGYAGGIVSSGIDGLRTAEAVISRRACRPA